jgi:sulfur relay (sulfurtransferase) DsrF/TusC family protein
MKTLQIVTSAYRCNVEEQDDPVLWIAQAMRTAGADVHVLLEGGAVNYAARGQDASGLSFGGKAQLQPARIEDDVARLAAKGDVYVVEEDVSERGLERGDLVAGIQGVSRAGLPRLFGRFEQVWRW